MMLWRALRDALPTCWVALLASLCCCCCCTASDNNVFTIRHERSNQCLQVKNLQLLAGNCQETKETLWTWVSQHRLFNLGSQKCLRLDVSKSQNRVEIVDCDSSLVLWWQCADAVIFSASQNKLALKNGVVTASIDSVDTWRRSNSSDVICKHPYREIYTRDGNSYGKPCEFPFLVNETWHHDCFKNEMFMDGEGCSTTSNFNRDRKWGLCLKQEDGCQNTWEHDANSGSCYQLNTQAALSWKEAYISCQRQGGDLLSIGNLAELNDIQGKDGIAETFWIGLNQLDISGGWQWSDHTPLNFLNWHPEMKDSSPLDGFGCVAMTAESGQWKSYPCETALPYVCKKQFNKTKSEFPVQNYMETRCDPNWFPQNGFCYILSNSSASWDDAHKLCKANNTDLISIHSLADVELVVVKLHIETKDKVWTGFMNKDTPAFFKWSDGSKVVFTYWDQDEPKIPSNSTPNCVAYSAELGRWNVVSCEEKLKYVCMKKGEILNQTKSDKDCPSNEEWKKHGDFCYNIEKDEVSFGKKCNLTITNRFEQEFINSLIRKHAKVEEKYFWTGLQDINSLGEYRWGSANGKSEMLTYTNWNNLQPAFPGGCVAMSGGRYLGKWEVQDCKTFKAYSVCKKYIGPQKEPEVLPKVTDPCPPGWHNGSGLACYKFFHKERVLRTRTWEEAERFCEALGGHLPSFSNMLEVEILHDTLRKIISDDRWVWIGLNKRNPESLGSWQWSDNKPVSTVVVPHNFQEDDYDTRDCAAVKTLKKMQRPYWHLHFLEDREEEDFYLKPFHCSSKLEWVCQISKGSSPKTPVWYKPDEDGIHGLPLNIDGSEFWFEPNKHLSYQEAALYCSRNGSDLASATSFTALTGILNRIANLSDENQIWWLKYYTHRYYPFFHRYPHYHERRFRDCVHISSQSWSRYNQISCSTKLPFICEKYNTSLLESHDPDYKPPQRSCLDGWTVFLNKCYRTVTPRNLTFKKAKEYCLSLGGMLPSIKSPAEQDFITSLLSNMPETVWIGLSVNHHPFGKKWVDNSVLEYSNFHPLLQEKLRLFQPYWFDDIDLCGVLLNDPKFSYVGTWNLTSCTDTLSVAICEHVSDAVENQTQESSTVTTVYRNVTYTIILKNLTWYEAQEECLQNSMQLVSITEQYQQAYLASQVAQHNYQLWTGLSSKDDGNNYQWSDGEHVHFSRWSDEDGVLVDDCVYLDSDGFWKTSDCYSKMPGTICYLPGNETEKTEVFRSIKCPHKVKNTPWIPFQNSCYTFMITKGRWKEMRSNEAHHLCKLIHDNASLLSIKDEKENNFVVEQLQSFGGFARWLRLGLIYEPVDNLLKWYDETHLTYNNWRLGRPSINNNYFVAGVNLDGFWDIDSYSHNDRYSHIDHHRSILTCKIEMVPKEDKLPLPKILHYGNDSYWILQKKLSWYKAWGECKQSGGDLASIRDESQQVFLEDIVKSDGFPLWFGLSSHNGSESDFEWSDGSIFDYKPWEYKHSRSSGNCFYLDTQGFWNRKKCTDNVDGAICYSPLKKTQSKKIESPTTCPQTTSESSQWIQYKGHCYAFDMAFYNFSIYTATDANKVCKKLDPSATVLTIKDAEENTFVITHLREHSFITGRVWLGMHSHAKSSNWLDDGSEVKYTNWAKGKASGECSIIFSTNGTWSQIDCWREQSRVVCKAPQVSNHTGGAIGVAVFIILALLAGLIFFLYKKKRLQWGGFSSVRYERGMHEDETDSMFTRDGD